MPPEPKTCVSCGRRIEWRKKWERSWDEVRYCSTACRRRGVTAHDRALQERIAELLAQGGARTSVDVSDVARTVAASMPGQDASDLEEPARRAARRLVAAGEAVIVQRGSVVDPSTAKGPFQVRRAVA